MGLGSSQVPVVVHYARHFLAEIITAPSFRVQCNPQLIFFKLDPRSFLSVKPGANLPRSAQPGNQSQSLIPSRRWTKSPDEYRLELGYSRNLPLFTLKNTPVAWIYFGTNRRNKGETLESDPGVNWTQLCKKIPNPICLLGYIQDYVYIRESKSHIGVDEPSVRTFAPCLGRVQGR